MAREQGRKSSKRLPIVATLGLVGLAVLYAVGQPLLNSYFGWQLPALASLTADSIRQSTDSEATSSHEPIDAARTSERSATRSSEQPRKADSSHSGDTRSGLAEPDLDATQLSKTFLREVGPGRYASPAGLHYGPGSAEGHRLAHLRRHMQDVPDRPGKHGVFDGDLAEVLVWIDDAYDRGKRRDKGVRVVVDENRMIYEVPFDRPIGYVGGRDGGRAGNPIATRMRLVVEGSRFVTAFPF